MFFGFWILVFLGVGGSFKDTLLNLNFKNLWMSKTRFLFQILKENEFIIKPRLPLQHLGVFSDADVEISLTL